MYRDKIAYHTAKLAEYQQKQAEYEAQQTAPSEELEALRNTIQSKRDGVGKVIADPAKPYPLYLPMEVDANQFYQLTERGISTKFVAVKSGLVDSSNFSSMLEEWHD